MLTNLRPLGSSGNASPGIYISDLITSSLLPLSLLSSYFSLPLDPIQTNISIISLGLTLSTWLTFLLGPSAPRANISIPQLAGAALTLFLLPPDNRINTYVVYWAIIVLDPLARATITNFPKCFTFGEVCLVCQAIILLCSSLLMKFLSLDQWNTKSVAIQLVKELKLTVDHLYQSQMTNICLLVFWTALVFLSILVVIVYNMKSWPVTTKTRKLFHLAISLVYLSGLLSSPLLLYIASVLAMTAMVIIELIRVSRSLPNLSAKLTQVLKPFLDTKDQGELILTNIYLLVGVSWPLWLWPGSLRSDNPVPLILYSGIVSVGLADSAASILGSLYGNINWFGSSKTVEGSVAALLTGLAFILTMSRLELVVIDNWFGVLVSLCITVLTEAVSEQVDNLTLPLVMYSVLAMYR